MSRLGDALRALRHRNFRLFFAGQIISLVGTWMQSIAESWLVYRLTGSAAKLGMVGFCAQIPVFVIAPLGGIAADQTNRRRTLVITQSASMALALLYAALTLSHRIQVWQIFVLAAGLGVVNGFDIPTRQAFVVDMVGKEDLMNAIALNSSLFNGARVIGPAIAGLLIGALGIAWCYFLNGLSYIAVIAGLLLMRLPPIVRSPQRPSAWSGFREVLTFLRGDRRLRVLMVLTAALSVFGFPYISMMPVFARDVLHRGATGYGALTSSIGIGAVIGALGVALASGRIHQRGRLMLIGGTAFGILLILFSASRSLALSMLLLGLTGCAMIVNNSITNTLLQTTAPDHLRGRIMGFYSFVFVGMAPFGAFMFGLAAEHVGAPIAIATGGAVVVLAVTAAGLLVPELRST